MKNEIKNVFILRKIVKLRNVVAYNLRVLFNLDKETRDNRLSNSRIRKLTYTLYMFNKIVTSVVIKLNVTKDINNLFYKRILLHKKYYNNELLKSIYGYFDTVIKKRYSINIEENSLE